MWFKSKEALNDVDLSMCNPIVVNQTNHSIVLFLDRGVLYNKQVLAPGEAVGMTRKETAGTVLPYKIHAVVGDEKSLPTRRQSIKNLASTAVIPTAFIVGTLMAASSAGTLTGPSRALSRAAGGIVVRGMVIDSAALAAGSMAANRACVIADKLLEKKPENFSTKSGHLLPGNRCVVVKGGIDESLTITTIQEKAFRQIAITGVVKRPMDTLAEKVDYYVPAMLRSSKTAPNEEDIKALEADAAENNETTNNDKGVPAIEEQQVAPSAPPAAAASAPSAESEDEQLRRALVVSAAAAANETDEDRQLRLAIEASLNLEEQRKKEQEAYNKLLKDDAGKEPVVLF